MIIFWCLRTNDPFILLRCWLKKHNLICCLCTEHKCFSLQVLQLHAKTCQVKSTRCLVLAPTTLGLMKICPDGIRPFNWHFIQDDQSPPTWSYSLFVAVGAAPFQQPSAAFKPESVSASRADILDEQDRGLDSLYEVIVRQKRIAQNIEGEVEIQVLLS